MKPQLGSLPNLGHPSRMGLALDLPMLGAGDFNDYSGNGNNGTNNGATWVDGPDGPALSFNGSNSYVNLGNSPLYPSGGAITASLWFLAREWGGDGTILRRNGGGVFDIDINDNREIRAWLSDYLNVVYPVTNVSLNTWYYLAVTHAPGQPLCLYIDGVEVARDSAGTGGSPTGDFYIGAEDGATDFFNGLIGSVSIYNRVLTAGEIKYLYDNPWQAWERDNLPLIAAATQGGASTTSTIVPISVPYNGKMKPSFGSLPLNGYPLRDRLALDLPMLGAGDFNDYSGNGNNGTNNGATWVAGADGPALRLDRTQKDAVEISPGRSILPGGWTPFSLIWSGVLPASQTVTSVIFGLGDTALSERANVVMQSHTEDYRFGFSSFGNFSTFHTTGFAGGICQLVYVFESATSRKLYFNGVLIVTDTDSVSTSGDPNIATIGCVPRNNLITDNSDQDASTFQIANDALTAAQIKDLYDNPWQAWQTDNTILFAAQGGTPIVLTGNPWYYNMQQLIGAA